MRRFFVFFAVLAALLFGGGTFAADKAGENKEEKPSFGFLKDWAGKEPEEVLPGNRSELKPHPALWDNPKVEKSLLNTLGKERTYLLTNLWGPEEHAIYRTLLEKFDQTLFFFSCKAGDAGRCGIPQAVIYIDMKNGEVYACWADSGGDAWLSPGGKSKKLPKGYCNSDDFDEKHNHETIYKDMKKEKE